MPAWRTIYDWMKKDDGLGDASVGLSASIAYARDVGYDNLAEQCLSIADTPMMGLIEITDDKGKKSMRTEEMLGHRKLQIDTRLKLLAKFHPKKYGDKVQVGGDPDAPPVQVDVKSFFDELLQNIELKTRKTSND